MTQAHAKARKSPWNPTAQSEKTSRLKSETEHYYLHDHADTVEEQRERAAKTVAKVSADEPQNV